MLSEQQRLQVPTSGSSKTALVQEVLPVKPVLANLLLPALHQMLAVAPDDTGQLRQPVGVSSRTQATTVQLCEVSSTAKAVDPLAVLPLNCNTDPKRPGTRLALVSVVGRLLPAHPAALAPLPSLKRQATPWAP